MTHNQGKGKRKKKRKTKKQTINRFQDDSDSDLTHNGFKAAIINIYRV